MTEANIENEFIWALLAATTSRGVEKRKHYIDLAKQIAESLPQEKVQEMKRDLLEAYLQTYKDEAARKRQQVIEQICEVTGYEH
jgi:hypothetical protein